MHADFWQERWQTGRIGFHEAQPNAMLTAHVGRLLEGAPRSDATGAPLRVLVPLSGKSNDLSFLAGQGCAVTGVEFVRQAAEAFFAEHALTPSVERWHAFESLSANGVRIAVGDFFTLAVPEAERFDAAYDRAALIAVRPEERERYVRTCCAALRPGARILLVTLDLGGAAGGPPFGVSEADVRRLYAGASIEAIAETDLSAGETALRERGASRVLEQAWLVKLAS